MNIFVGSLSFKTTEEKLQREFEAFGEVESVKIIIDRETLKSRGFAFVTMPDQGQATAAIAAMNGKEIDGFALKVNEARPRDAARPPSRERTGGYGNSSERPRTSYSSPGGYGGGRDRTPAPDYTIYDTKDGRSGGGAYGNKKGRGEGGRGGNGGGRSGGGRRSY